MLEKIIVVGDLHLQEKQPKRKQTEYFLDWFFKKEEFNKPENILFLLGDLVESIDCQHELLETYVDYFTNISKFNKVYILQGNHDSAINTTLLSVFRPLKNVEIITTWKELKIENLSCLCLPHFKHEGTLNKSMKEEYQSLEGTYDYCFHHLTDHTMQRDKNFVDLSKLKISNYICGHHHNEDITKGGHYLGSPILNSITEKGKKCIIASIDIQTKQYEIIESPKFLEYYDVFYPQELPTVETPLALLTVYDSIDKEETIEYYKEKGKDKEYQFSFRAIYSKRIKQEDIDTSLQYKVANRNDEDYFNQYVQVNKVEESVKDICLDIIKKSKENI